MSPKLMNLNSQCQASSTSCCWGDPFLPWQCRGANSWIVFAHLGTYWVVPLPVTVTTKIITFLVGDPYKPSFATVTGRGDNPRYISDYATQLYGDYFINHEINNEIRIPMKINQDSMESKAVFFSWLICRFWLPCPRWAVVRFASPEMIHRHLERTSQSSQRRAFDQV